MTATDDQQRPAPPPWAEALPNPEHTLPWWRSTKTVLSLLLLVLLLILVVFWLPNQISAPAVTPTKTTSPQAPSQPQPALESPWSDAQLAKQRREAQDILARLLDKQQSLEAAAVTLWAEESYNQALTLAHKGDELYRQREFDPAKQAYLTAEEQMDELIALQPSAFAQHFEEGLAAVEDNQSETALSALQIATAIEPDHQGAKDAYARAQVLDKVITLVKESDHAIQLSQLTLAREKLNQAAGLDGQSDFVQDKLNSLAQLETHLSFQDRMSQGYSALQTQNYTGAIAAFKGALSLNPKATDAQEALTQARNAASQQTLNSYLTRAQNFAAQEQWAQAVIQYDKALKQDNSLVKARVDRIKAQARLQLDTSITEFLAKPNSLSEPPVFEAAQQTLADAQSLAQPNTKLAQQAAQLSQALKWAQTPVTVTLRSDNQTKVTLYRIGQLGVFDQQSLALKPGQYVLVGSRAGYRDVRKEFTVEAQQEQTTILIQCTEPVANG